MGPHLGILENDSVASSKKGGDAVEKKENTIA